MVSFHLSLFIFLRRTNLSSADWRQSINKIIYCKGEIFIHTREQQQQQHLSRKYKMSTNNKSNALPT